MPNTLELNRRHLMMGAGLAATAFAAGATQAQAEADATKVRVEQRANVRAQIYGVLTSAQKMQLASMKAQREQRRQEWKAFQAQHRDQSTSTSNQ